jgi:hypothetical protein
LVLKFIGAGDELLIVYFEDIISPEIWRQIAPRTYFNLWGRIGPPRKVKLQNRIHYPKKLAVWKRLLSVWKRMEAFGSDSKRMVVGLIFRFFVYL